MKTNPSNNKTTKKPNQPIKKNLNNNDNNKPKKNPKQNHTCPGQGQIYCRQNKSDMPQYWGFVKLSKNFWPFSGNGNTGWLGDYKLLSGLFNFHVLCLWWLFVVADFFCDWKSLESLEIWYKNEYRKKCRTSNLKKKKIIY